MNIEKILTDVPYLDEIVYYTKILALGTVLKNPTEATNNETLESARSSTLYLASVDNYLIYQQIELTEEILRNAGIPDNLYDKYLNDSSIVPEAYRSRIINAAKDIYIKNYVEYNNYYRMLYGLPDIGDPGIKITDQDWALPEGIIFDELDKYIHEMSNGAIEVLDTYGVIDNLIEQYPEKMYLRHLGDRKIEPYVSRKGKNFEPLYMPSIDSSEIYDKFKTRLDINRAYTIKTIYSEAFKYGSDYYDNFISVLIIVQTMLDIISTLQEVIAKKEVFDLRSIQYIFQSAGVPFYPEIPLKYQIAMVKNLNTLIKYKSTTKNMVDICSLFGFDNIEIFKYYLLKERKLNDDGSYQFNTKTIEINDPNNPGQMKEIEVENVDANYDLKFIKVPLEDKVDNHLKNYTNHLDYDTITDSDPSWNGDLAKETVKSMIINEEFNTARTKYISIDTVYDVAKMANDIAYFYNILYDYYDNQNVKLEENLTLFIPSLGNNAFRLTDVFCYLFALAYISSGIKDDIMNTQGKILHVNGFNFKTNLAELASYIESKGYTLKELGVDEFDKPTTSITSYTRLMEIFIKNSKIRDHLVSEMANADNKRIYDIYKYLYDALMISEFNNEYFKNPITGEMPKTYTEYLHSREGATALALSLEEISSINESDARNQRIASIINNVLYAIDEYIDTVEYNYLFAKLPSVSADQVKNYIAKVINFFKSYKVDMLGIDTVYKFDDKLGNMIRAIDDYQLNSIFDKEEFIQMIDKLKLSVNMSKDERYQILDKIYFDIFTWVYKTFKDSDYIIKKEIITFNVFRLVRDYISNEDMMYIITKINKDTYLNLVEKLAIVGNLNSTDNVSLKEHLNNQISIMKSSMNNIDDEFLVSVYKNISDALFNLDSSTFKSISTKSDSVDLEDRLYINAYNS